MDRRAGDAGATLVGWVAGLAVAGAAGLLAVDAVSIGTCLLTGEDLASSAASAASNTWTGSHRADLAYAEAVRRVHETDPTASVPPASFSVAADGTVHLAVRRTARTFLVSRLPGVRERAVVTTTGTASAAP